jgi:chaperonin GroEL (HSP60 family)
MLMDTKGEVTITNNPAIIETKIDVTHNAAKLVIEAAKAQLTAVGDGIARTVIFAGELLKQVEYLLDLNIHPVILRRGIDRALAETLKIMAQVSIDTSLRDKNILRNLALTSLRGKCSCTETQLMHLVDICVAASQFIAPTIVSSTTDYKSNIDLREYIKFMKRVGSSYLDTVVVDGIVLDKIHHYAGMKFRVPDARIVLVNNAIVLRKMGIDLEVQLTTVQDETKLLAMEDTIYASIVEHLVEIGANVVICRQWIDDRAQHYLAKNGIFTLREVPEIDMRRISKATGAKIVSSLRNVNRDDLGYAGLVECKKTKGEVLAWITACKQPQAITIFLRGSASEQGLAELEELLRTAINNIVITVYDKKLVPGGGAIEMELAVKLRDYASSISGYEHLVVEAFANALEAIPRALAENAGLDPLDAMLRLRTAHKVNAQPYAGIDLDTGKVVDMVESGVLDPYLVNLRVFQIGTELAKTILSIDEQINIVGEHERAKRKRKEEEAEAFGKLREREARERMEMEELGDYDYVRKHMKTPIE